MIGIDLTLIDWTAFAVRNGVIIGVFVILGACAWIRHRARKRKHREMWVRRSMMNQSHDAGNR